MVPLGDGNPTRTTAIVNYSLIGANVLVFLHEMTLSKSQLKQFFDTWSIIPLHLTQSFQGHANFGPYPEWITLLTSQFLHGGFLHIAGNMLYLWIFGNNVEDQLGHIKYLFFYLACGVVAGLAQWFFSAYSTTPSLGASGAIAGVLGAYILRFPRAQVLTLIPLGFFFWTIRLPAYVFLGWWFVQQSFYGLAGLGARTNIGMEHGGVAYWAHVGGFIAGVILGPLLGLFA